MTVEIRVRPGFDYRDISGDTRGARGLRMDFAVVEPGAEIPWACWLDVDTGWMSRPLSPLAGDAVWPVWLQMKPLERSGRPGLDRGDDGPLVSAVRMCVPAGTPGFESFIPPDGEICPWLGVECKSTVGYLASAAPLRALIEGGLESLERELRTFAAAQFEFESGSR